MEEMHVEEEVSRLSFSNLLPRENYSGSLQHSPRNTSPRSTDQFFEFFTSQTLPVYSNPGTVFCGKIIQEEEEEYQRKQYIIENEYQKRDYFANRRSPSFRKSSITARKENRDILFRRYSGPTQFSTAPSYRVQSVNISALTSMSAKSRRRMFMFGPVKFKPEMELSEIKQRLRREPAPGKEVVSGGGVDGIGRTLWNVVRSNLRLRWQRSRVLVKSFGCIPVGDGGSGGSNGGRRWIDVSN